MGPSSPVPSPALQGLAVIPGLGLGVPLPSSSGVPPFSSFASALGVPPAAPGWPLSGAYAHAPHASFHAAPPVSDPLSDSKGHLPHDDHPSFDPSAPPLSLDSSRSEYRCMVEYVLGLFPQATGTASATPPPCALFESFFASASPSPQSLSFNWFD